MCPYISISPPPFVFLLLRRATQVLFDRVEGVLETKVGYTQGNTVNPTYEQICTGGWVGKESLRETATPLG